MHRSRERLSVLGSVLALVCCTGVLSGCGGGEESDSAKTSSANGGEAGGEGEVVDDGGAPGVGAPDDAEIRTDAEGRKWFGDVPLDVWYGDPLQVAADDQTVAVNTPDGAESPGEEPMPMEDEPEAGAGDAADWQDVIPAGVVDGEVTEIKNLFDRKLKTIASYNSGYLSLPPHIATLAVMSHIATLHPDEQGEIRWKEHAPLIRTMASQMGEVELRRGAASFKKLEEPYLNIQDTLAGSPPAGVEAEEGGFADTAAFGELMNRLDVASKWLKIEVSSEEALKEKEEDVIHEASVLAALAKVINHEDFGYNDGADYESHSLPMMEAGVSMAEAARSGDYAAYDKALTRVYKSCTDCHRVYRN